MSVVLLRTVILYMVIVFALRIMGKRQLGELEPSELVVTILVSNIATLSIEDTNIPLLGSILPIFMLVTCEVLVSVLLLKSNWARKIISGNPRIIIRDGEIDQKEMRNLRWSIEDLMEQLRNQGIFDPTEVSFAMVETSGTLSVYQKFPNRPLTNQDMSLPQPAGHDGPPVVLITDGYLVRDAMRYCGVDQAWLDKVLRREKLALRDIFLMTCDKNAAYEITRRSLDKGGMAK